MQAFFFEQLIYLLNPIHKSSTTGVSLTKPDSSRNLRKMQFTVMSDFGNSTNESQYDMSLLTQCFLFLHQTTGFSVQR